MPRTGRIAEFAGYRLDLDERTLRTPSGSTEQLTARLFDTLVLLLEHAGQLVEKGELMEHVWKDVVVEENTLSRTVSSLREKLGEAEGGERIIETVSGRGYRLRSPVRYSRGGGAEPLHGQPTLAVLPFEDLSPNRDQQHVAEGFADELISTLANFPSLRLTARGSAFQLHGADARRARERLGATHLLTGSLRRHGDRLRASVQLVDTGTEQQLWAAQRDGSGSDLFALQEAIAQAVRVALRELLNLAPAPPRAPRTPDPAAYDLYLRARVMARSSGGPAITQACNLLRRAVTLDPDFALGWAQLSVWSRAMILFGVQTSEDLPRNIEQAAERTMALEPGWWPAHVASSSLCHLRRDWLGMAQALDRAHSLVGNHPPELMIHLASMQLFVGRPRAALTWLREAIDSDPLSLIVSGVWQMAMHMAGDEAGAEREYQRSLTLTGDRDMIEHLAIHRLWAQRLPFDAQLRRYLQHQSTVLPVLHELQAVQGDPDRAVPLLVAALPEPTYAPPARQSILAWWLAHYGATDAAMDILWRVHVERGHIHTSWLWFPVFAPVRALPRFEELADRVGFSRYWERSGNGPEV